ncbi:type VI secretion system tip protein VgrG, partial [Paraburkholderia silviterrae]
VPRIGQEVVVDFLNGELDRPLVTGRIYNAEQMPPFSLPGAATQSGIVTRTPGGTTANANMLRFEDKAGAEQVLLHAERNLDIAVENNATHTVGGDKTTTIDGNSTTTINGNSITQVNGNSISQINGNQVGEINGNALTVVAGTSSTIVFGNNLIGTIGSQELLNTNQLIGAIVQEFVVGQQLTAIGSTFGVVGVSGLAAGVQMGMTGVRVSKVSTAVDSIDTSVTHVGCSCKF